MCELIKVRDIARVFSSPDASALLDVLQEKADALEEKASSLRDLKNIVMDFIDHVKAYDFNDRQDIARLYAKAHLAQARLERTAAPLEKLQEVSKKLETAPVVSVVDLPCVTMARRDEDQTGVFEDWRRKAEAKYKPLFTGNLSWFNFYTEKTVNLYALPYGFHDDCPFETFKFPGGLHATATFLDDPYDYAFETNTGYLYKWVGESEDYRLHLTENTPQARFIMWRDKPSVGKEQPQVDFFVPIENKSDAEKKPAKAHAAEKLLGTAKTRHRINLGQLTLSGEISARYAEGGLQIFQQGQEGYCRTQETFRLPLRIRLTAKTDSANIRVSFGQAIVLLNWGVSPGSLMTADVLEGGHYRIDGAGCVEPNRYADITWVIQRECMALIVDGQVRAYREDYPYIRKLKEEPALDIADCVRLHTAFGATVTVRELEIFELDG